MLNLAQQQQLNKKIPTSSMKTNSKLKEGDPIRALTGGKPLTWAPLVGTKNSTSASTAALLLSQLSVLDSKTQSNESCEFCHSQDGNQRKGKESQFFQQFYHPVWRRMERIPSPCCLMYPAVDDEAKAF
ncbi:hypothetical protein TURU_092978 [Turdus rufiventris]|nr:hypothetical protein TURU_092978 [Turdus rufiventris]